MNSPEERPAFNRINPQTVNPKQYLQELEKRLEVQYDPKLSRRRRMVAYPWPEPVERVVARLKIDDLVESVKPKIPDDQILISYGFPASKHLRRYLVTCGASPVV